MGISIYSSISTVESQVIISTKLSSNVQESTLLDAAGTKSTGGLLTVHKVQSCAYLYLLRLVYTDIRTYVCTRAMKLHIQCTMHLYQSINQSINQTFNKSVHLFSSVGSHH